MKYLWLRWRTKVAWWLLGPGWSGTVARLWVIRARAMEAVHKDGSVVLAHCESLAEALYEPLPGEYSFTMVRHRAPTATEETVDECDWTPKSIGFRATETQEHLRSCKKIHPFLYHRSV